MGAPQRAFPSAELPYGLWVACLAGTRKPELLTRPAPQCNLSDTDHLYDKNNTGAKYNHFSSTAPSVQHANCSAVTHCHTPALTLTQTPSFPHELAKCTRALPPAHTRSANAPQLSAKQSSYQIKTGLARST